MSKLSTRFEELLEGIDVECDFSEIPRDEPVWLDKDRFLRGQKFFRDNSIGILDSNFRSLVIGLSFKNLR